MLSPSVARKVLPVVFAGKDSVRGQRNVREKRLFERKVRTRVRGTLQRARKEDRRDPTKRESKDSTRHGAWVETRTLAARDAVETVDVVVVAEEVEAEVPMRPCLGRHLK